MAPSLISGKRGRDARQVLWRVYRIHNSLSSGRCRSLRDLAEEYEVSDRTVERDLEQLRDLSAPIVYDRNRRGYRYDGPFTLPPVSLSAGELAVLLIGQRLLADMAGTPFADAARTVIDKLPAVLNERVSFEARQAIPGDITFAVPPVRGDADSLAGTFSVLADAISRQQTVTMEYYTVTRDSVSRRAVDPYHLRLVDAAWYLIGYCHTRNELRTFAVDRILDVTITDACFTRLPGFRIDDYLRSSWGIEHGAEYAVQVLFDAEQARWIRERVWQQDQVLTDVEDGGVLLEARVSGLESIKRWILSFGHHAKAVAPPELVAVLANEACAMAEGYRTKS